MTITSRQRIVTEAVRLFSEQGYAATTIRDIARGVGLLPGSLYAHIDDKEGLLVEIVEGGIDKFLAAIESVVDSPEPADVRLREAIKAHIRVIAENVDQTSVVFHQWKHLAPDRRADIVGKRNRYEEIFTRLIQDGVESHAFGQHVNPRITVLAVLGMLNWVPEWFSPQGPETADEVGERLADLVLSGLLEPQPATAPAG
jgi:AcrR family transcriptional regulator